MRALRVMLHSSGGAAPTALVVLVGALLAGSVVGVGLAASGAIDLIGGPTRVAGYDQASYYDCADGAALGAFIRGDRVYVTGRDASGGWVEVRSPVDPGRRVWVRAHQVIQDSVVDLPVVECPPASSAISVIPHDGSVTTTTTSPGATTTTTIAPGVTTTTAPGLPSVGPVATTRNPIWEGYETDEASGVCLELNPGQFIKSEISAVVTAPAGVQSVVMEWSVGAVSGSKPMTLSAGSYRAILGRFDAVNPNVVPNGGSAMTITVTVRATDTLGQVATAQRSVTLEDCNLG